MSPSNANLKAGYQFTTHWFTESARLGWERILPLVKPQTILEIGAFEGASACYLIETLGSQSPLSVHCIDTWQGGVEHQGHDMEAVEQRFDANTALAISGAKHRVTLEKYKGPSDAMLVHLLAKGYASRFDFIYVDGSHQACDVLADAVLAFRLCRSGGVIVFDDYLWMAEGKDSVDLLHSPKLAIDAFTSIYRGKLTIIPAPLFQMVVVKTKA